MKRHYPRGKLRADDDGNVEMRFAIQDNTLLIIFPHPTTWIGLGLAEVKGLRELLAKYEAQLESGAA